MKLSILLIAVLALIACHSPIDSPEVDLYSEISEVSESRGEVIFIDEHLDNEIPFAWVSYESGDVTFVYDNGWTVYDGRVWIIQINVHGE